MTNSERRRDGSRDHFLGLSKWLILFAFLFVLGLPACQQGGPAPPKVKGPEHVPDFSEYAYATSCAKKDNPQWSVSDPVGTISAGQGTPDATISWGGGPKAATISVACGSQTGTLDVQVMQVQITNTAITTNAVEDADSDPNPDFQYARAGHSEQHPGIKFVATITVTGPVAGTDGPKHITTGYVQVMRSVGDWQSSYAAGDTPLFAILDKTPPWHDQVKGDSDAAKAWYTKHVGANFTPTPGKLADTITTWDGPKTGWPKINKQGKSLGEAISVWRFTIWICTQTDEMARIYFNRAEADWTFTANWGPLGGQVDAPGQFSLLQDRSLPSPITGMLVNDGISDPNRHFENRR